MPSEVKMPVVAWRVEGGRSYLDRPFAHEATAHRCIEERKDESRVAPLVRQSDALAYADAKVREALERAAHIGHCLGKFSSYDIALIRMTEHMQGITGDTPCPPTTTKSTPTPPSGCAT